MKAKELRIGNIVLNEMNHRIEVNYNTLCNMCEFDVVYRPVKLTEEWIKMFGFKIVEENEYDIEILYERYFSLVWKKKENQFDCLVGHSVDWVIIAKIKYVHQLQNLYHSLTQEELPLDTNPTKNRPSK